MGPVLNENDPAPCPNDRTPMSMNDPRAINRGLGQAEYPTVNLCAFEEHALKVFSGYDSGEPIDDTPTDSAISPLPGGAVGQATGILGWPIAEADYKGDTSCFGDDRDGGSRKHAGVDLIGKAGQGRTQILAADGGHVAYVGDSERGGGTVHIQHAEKKYTSYRHMVKIQVKQGQAIAKGQVIGYEGNTGTSSTGSHLHFELGSTPDGAFSTHVNPLSFLEPWSGAYQANTSCPR